MFFQFFRHAPHSTLFPYTTLFRSPATRMLSRMSDLHLVQMQNGEVQLTPVGSQRARDVVRRHRLAERARLEEHTSELQSPMIIVCRLLLEQKNKIITSFKKTSLLD